MKKDFWLERWEREETGFHQNEINSYLRQFWQELDQQGEVFVPLCGKSLDMLWLREQGYTVLGVELSAIAVQSFFSENGYSPQQHTRHKFDHSEADRIRILCGDFFDLSPDDVSCVRMVYDRASMVALPPEMREKYVRHLLNILPDGAQILLITFEYPQGEMNGPPFSVSVAEVENLYREHAKIRYLARLDVLAQNPRFAARGVSQLHENIFLLTVGQ